MKKKGLIISTVVMAVVLIASLTTATYAWFTTTATAKIESIQVQTATSQGLEIAIYSVTDGSFTSGDTDLDNYVWKGGVGGSGSSLSFNMSATQFFSVSGDGQDMYSPSNLEQGVFEGNLNDGSQAGKTAATMKIAEINKEYFVANVALLNTKVVEGATTNDEVVIKSLSITPSQGGSADTTGIVNAMRIAVFERTEYSAAPTLRFVINPYSNVLYAKNLRQFSISPEATQESTNSKAVTQYLVATDSYDAETSNTYNITNFTKGSFESGKYIAGAATTTTTIDTTTGPTGLIEYKFDDTAATEYLSLGDVDRSDVKYLQIVIWFEGEDIDCINMFAGGGASVGFDFGFASEITA